MEEGTIKRLTDKGFGFISSRGQDIFFHQSSLEGTRFEDLREGERATFEKEEGPKGPRATLVRAIERS